MRVVAPNWGSLWGSPTGEGTSLDGGSVLERTVKVVSGSSMESLFLENGSFIGED